MKKADDLFTATKHQTPKGVRVYTVRNFFNEVVCTTKSRDRDYVALLIWHEGDRFHVQNRFGRMDLVGKGDSKHYIDDDRAILVKVD